MTNEKKQTAQHNNIRAAKLIADTVRSTLGPAGMDKMMVDGGGNVIVTNDGATILQQLDVAHPGAKMIVEAANTQESLCYDGTTTTTVLAGSLLGNSEPLFEKGLHSNIVCKGYRQAAKWAVDHIESNAVDAKDYLSHVAKTAITGKSLETSMEHVSSLCVKAAEQANGDIKRIRVIGQPGGSLDDSHCFGGVMLNQTFLTPNMPKKPKGRVLLVNTGLSTKKEEGVQVNLQSVSDIKSYKQYADKDIWQSKVEAIVELMPKGGVVFSRDSVNELVAALLAKNNISVAHRVPPSDLDAMATLLGTTVSHSVDDLLSPVNASVEQKTVGDMEYVIVEGDGNVTTLVLRGATRQTLDETERGFDDALGVVCLAYNSGEVVTGGGSSYVSAALNLRSRAAEIGGRAQMAIEAFADALEAIPSTIAENAGFVPLDTILALRNDHQQGIKDAGPDIENGGTCSMIEANVWEPLGLVRQAILSASEVSISILRIDDIIGKKSDE
jgi:chaperonin GroEL (HSP60 family)